MRLMFATAVVVSLVAMPSIVTGAHADTMKQCAAKWNSMSAADKSKTTYKSFSAQCMKGGAASATPAAAAPAAAAAQPARAAKTASAKASKGAKTASAEASGAAKTASAKASDATKTASAAGPAPSGATGVCKDGSYTTSKTHSGACSHHGGVAKWL